MRGKYPLRKCFEIIYGHFKKVAESAIPYIKYPNTKSYNPNLLPVESEKVGNCITIDLWTSSGHIQSHQRLMFLIDKPEK